MLELLRKRKRKLRRRALILNRKGNYNPFRWLWLLALLLSVSVVNFFVTLKELAASRRTVVPSVVRLSVDDDDVGHPNEYERGGPPARLPRVYDQWGYSYRPSLPKLLRDLSLPGRLGRDAAGALLARIHNPDTKVWAAVQIDDGNYLELRRAMQASVTEMGILAAWDRFAFAEAATLIDEDDEVPASPNAVLKPK